MADPVALGQFLRDEVIPSPHAAGKHIAQQRLHKRGAPMAVTRRSNRLQLTYSHGRKLEAHYGRRDSINTSLDSIEGVSGLQWGGGSSSPPVSYEEQDMIVRIVTIFPANR